VQGAELVAVACASWAEEQNVREYRGEPYLDHQAFLLRFYRAGLAAAMPQLADSELAERAAELLAYSEEIRHWAAMPGAREVLELFRSRGRRAGLVSNFSAGLRQILASLELLGLLDPLVVSAEVGIEKPDPRILALACEQARVSPARAVYVGDHPLDVVCARKAGLPVIWVTDSRRPMPPELGVEPDLRCAVVGEVPRLLGFGAV